MCPFGVMHRAMKILFQVPASPVGQLFSAGVGEVRNFLVYGLRKTVSSNALKFGALS